LEGSHCCLHVINVLDWIFIVARMQSCLPVGQPVVY
jgi:hypothetical protein